MLAQAMWVVVFMAIGALIGVIIMDNREALAELKAEVTSNNSVVNSAVTLINGLNNRITTLLATATGDDLVTGLQELRSELDAQSTTLANAVATGTASEGDSPDFPPTETAENSGVIQDSTTSSEEESTGAIDTSSQTPSADEASEVAEDATVDDSAAGVDEELDAAEEQVPGEATEELPTAGEVFGGEPEEESDGA